MPGEFEGVEAEAEVGRVGEGVELADGGLAGGGGKRGEGFDPSAAVADEEGSLGFETGQTKAEAAGRFGDCGEIDVGADVEIARGNQRVVAGLVEVIGAESAGMAERVEEFRAGKAVIEEQQAAVRQRVAQRAEEGGEIVAKLGLVAVGESGVGQCGVVERLIEEGQRVVGVEGDEAFEPALVAADGEAEREGVEDLVGDDEAGERVGGERVVGGEDGGGGRGELGLLGGAQGGERFEDDVFGLRDAGKGGQGTEQILGEGGVVGTGFDQAPAGRLAGGRPPGEQAAGEELGKNGPDRDGSEEIAVADERAGMAGVVAVVGVVEGNFKKIVETERAVVADTVGEEGQDGGCGITGETPVPLGGGGTWGGMVVSGLVFGGWGIGLF